MPLLYLRHADLDLTAWDACVAAAGQPVPYAQAAWLQATNGRWDAVVEPDPATGGYRSLLPVPVQRRPWGREALQPPFTQQLGLLTTPGSQHREVGEYLALLPGRFARLQLQLNTNNPPPVRLPTGFASAERLTYHLPLAADYETVAASYCADYRRRLRLARQQAAPIRIGEETNLSPLVELFLAQKGEVPGMKPAYYQRLQQLHEALAARQQTLLLAARDPLQGQLLAGALFVRYRSRLVYLFAAASSAGKKNGAPLLLLDAAIQRYAGTPGLVLDFEGGMIPSIARFFANFGARPVPYYSITQLSRPWYLTWMR